MALRALGDTGTRYLPRRAPIAVFGPFANAHELFQADKTARMGVQDLLGDGMVGTQLKPSRLSARWRSDAESAATCLCAGVVFGDARCGQLSLAPAHPA